MALNVTLIDRGDARQHVYDLIADNVAAFTVSGVVQGFTSEPLKTHGLTPFFAVWSGGTRERQTQAIAQYHTINVGLYVQRSAATLATVENTLDDLSKSVRTVLYNNSGKVAGKWQRLMIDLASSVVGYAEIDGLQYRVEVITLEAMYHCA